MSIPKILTGLFYFRLKPTVSFAALCVLFIAASTSAQVVQTHRYERIQKNADEYFTVISLKEEGVALLREKDKYNGSKKLWEVVVLDTALQEKKSFDLEIDQRHRLMGYENDKGRLYLLYRTGETNKNSLVLIDINIVRVEEAARYEIKPELDFKLTHFSKVGANMVLGGYVSNEPAVLLYEISKNQIKVIPGFFQKDTELVDLRVNQNQTFNAALLDRSLRTERKLVFKTFDESGKLLLDDIVPVEDQKSLQTSISSTLIREDLMVLGSWGERQSKQSLGFYSLVVDPFGEQKIKYFHFGELNHFLDYMNPKRAARIKENTRADVLAGRRPAYTAYVMPFKIEEQPEGFLLLAEVYNPSTNLNPYYNNPYNNPYYNNPYYYYNPFWPAYYPGMRMYRPYAYGSNVKNADEIKTYETVLVGFDAQGNVLWDQSIKLDDIKKPALEQVSEFHYSKSKVIFLYKKESELKVKTILAEDDKFVETTEKIKMNDPFDEVRMEVEGEEGLKHWTGNSFFVWGYQTIRNIHKEDRVREVFYVNKVVVK